MPQWKFTLTANAGVLVETPGFTLWSDALHVKQVPGFSAVPPDCQRALLQSPNTTAPDLIFYSHNHPDHYAEGPTAQALARFPAAHLASPTDDFPSHTVLTQSSTTLSLPGATLRFAALPHEPGTAILPLPHYGALAEIGGRRLLLTGDCKLEAPALAELTGGEPVDVAVVNFPWVTLRRGRAFLQTHIRPRHVIVCHLPFAQDECNNYRSAALRAVTRQTELPDVRLLWDCLQSETIDL